LSAEYLLGPQLGQNILALGAESAVREALKQLVLDLDALLADEVEPALGNGGLGRLAACFMDSMATLDIPAIGYGIRYEFGIFEQAIRDGAQTELKELLGAETYDKIRRDLTRILEGQQGRGGGQQGGMQEMGTRIFDRMKEDLGLSDEQVEKIKPVTEELTKTMRTIFEDARGQGREGFQAMGEKMKEATDAFVEKAKECLSDEQKTKFDELMERMRRMGPGGRRGGGGGGN
jgi:hypothetical protein